MTYTASVTARARLVETRARVSAHDDVINFDKGPLTTFKCVQMSTCSFSSRTFELLLVLVPLTTNEWRYSTSELFVADRRIIMSTSIERLKPTRSRRYHDVFVVCLCSSTHRHEATVGVWLLPRSGLLWDGQLQELAHTNVHHYVLLSRIQSLMRPLHRDCDVVIVTSC